mmetsp:Transcript_1633/g.5157  ORF Transcript_1633/g.5157 Transcript_1633/m.5157 type:complete len:120 (-) Transcript_1633:95-454(-)
MALKLLQNVDKFVFVTNWSYACVWIWKSAGVFLGESAHDLRVIQIFKKNLLRTSTCLSFAHVLDKRGGVFSTSFRSNVTLTVRFDVEHPPSSGSAPHVRVNSAIKNASLYWRGGFRQAK